MDDFKDFKNYIFYAFNYQPLIAKDLTIYSTYRLVVNEHVSKKNESIADIRFLKYPPLEVVRNINKYNRANTPDTTIFYSAGSIDTALKEIKPPLDKLVTVGVWKPRNMDKKLISYPISHSDKAAQVNEGVRAATNAFEDAGRNISTLFTNYMRNYLKLLGHEYSKRVDHHYEYLISAMFSERIFLDHQEINDNNNFKFDCILYPSVGDSYLTDNVAILPATLDSDFYLSKVIEFEIIESYYDSKSTNNQAETITLAKIRNLKEAMAIDNDGGQIRW